jgi:hypothetical protein
MDRNILPIDELMKQFGCMELDFMVRNLTEGRQDYELD